MENKNYLAHHGTKGQRWGIRRWQNPDGSLTPAGREHYGYGDERDSLSKYDIKRLKAETKAKIKYEKAQQKMNAKLEKVKNAEKERKAKAKAAEKAAKDKEKAEQRARDIAEQKKQIAEFKKKHPLKYNQLKKYLTKEGVLNDAGKALFFGNGDKKNISQMSNIDLINSTKRMNLEAQYRQAAQNLENMSPSARKKFMNIMRQGGMEFAIQLGTRTLGSIASGDAKTAEQAGEAFMRNSRSALSSAFNRMGYATTRELGLGQGNIFDMRSPQQRMDDEISGKVAQELYNYRVNSEVQARMQASVNQLRNYNTSELNRQNISSGEQAVRQALETQYSRYQPNNYLHYNAGGGKNNNNNRKRN